MNIQEDLYVRAFLPCHEVATPTADSRNVVGSSELFVIRPDRPDVVEAHCFIAVERNRDTAAHAMVLTWQDKLGQTVWSSPAAPLPGPSTGGSVTFTTRIPIPWRAVGPGRLRLLLLIDGNLAAWAPLELR